MHGEYNMHVTIGMQAAHFSHSCLYVKVILCLHGFDHMWESLGLPKENIRYDDFIIHTQMCSHHIDLNLCQPFVNLCI